MSEMDGSIGLVKMGPARDRVAEERRVAEARQAAPVISSLSTHITKCWTEASMYHNEFIRPELEACAAQLAGEYDASLQGEIQKLGGTSIYLNQTARKALAGESWVLQVLGRAGKRAWKLDPTPKPELPPELKAKLSQRLVSETQAMGPMTAPQISDMAGKLEKQLHDAVRDCAATAADKLSDHVADMLLEGGYERAFRDVVRDFFRYPIAILKGPELKTKSVLEWTAQGAVRRQQLVQQFTRVSPWNFFPAPNVIDPSDSYCIERITIPRYELSSMRQLDGWDAAAIDLALDEAPEGSKLADTLTSETERSYRDKRDPMVGGGAPRDSVEALQFWGMVPGSMIEEWGMSGVEDPNEYYAVTAGQVGGYVVRAIINPDKLGRSPYYCTSFEHSADSLYGESLPKKIRDAQRAICASARAAINSLSWSSGPMVFVDIDAVEAGTVDKLTPWAVIPYHGLKAMGARDPVRIHQTQPILNPCLEMIAFLQSEIDSLSGIPNFVQGDTRIGGAGETSSGLRQFTDLASKNIMERVLTLYQDIVQPAIERVVDWLYSYQLNDPAIRGDLRVVPVGAVETLLRETAIQSRKELLALTNNPTDMQLIGPRGRAALLRPIAAEMGLDPDEIVISDDGLRAREQAAAQAEAQRQQMQMAAANAQSASHTPLTPQGAPPNASVPE